MKNKHILNLQVEIIPLTNKHYRHDLLRQRLLLFIYLDVETPSGYMLEFRPKSGVSYNEC